MPNVKSTISKHSYRLLKQTILEPKSNQCNCRKADERPLDQKCLTDNVVYKAKVTAMQSGRGLQGVHRNDFQ